MTFDDGNKKSGWTHELFTRENYSESVIEGKHRAEELAMAGSPNRFLASAVERMVMLSLTASVAEEGERVEWISASSLYGGIASVWKGLVRAEPRAFTSLCSAQEPSYCLLSIIIFWTRKAYIHMTTNLELIFENVYVIKWILHRCQVPDSVFNYTNYTNPKDKKDIHPHEKFSSHFRLKNSILGFPGGAVVENLPANAGDMGSSPGLGRSHMPRSN